MSLDQPALMLYFVASSHHAPDTSAVAILAAMFGLQLAIMLVLRRIFRPDGGDGDDPGSGGDDPGWGRDRGPRTPPPEGPVCWPEFERQFADYVAAQGFSEPERPRSATRRRAAARGPRPPRPGRACPARGPARGAPDRTPPQSTMDRASPGSVAAAGATFDTADA
jgi:hypothetical protein